MTVLNLSFPSHSYLIYTNRKQYFVVTASSNLPFRSAERNKNQTLFVVIATVEELNRYKTENGMNVYLYNKAI